MGALAWTLVACGPPGVSDDTSQASEGESSGQPDPTSSTSTTDDPSTGDPSETEAGSETETGDQTSFVPEFDVTGQLCDTWQQDCPEGEKCVPYASEGAAYDSVKCVPITGDQAPGEPCAYGGPSEATDDCALGSMCWYVEEIDGQLLGECVSLCTGTPDLPTCPESQLCTLSGDGVLHLCLPDCEPLLQDCGSGQGCYWTGGEFMCVPAAEPGLEPGAGCGFINDCVPGSICVDAGNLPDCVGDVGCCTSFCELGLGDGPCEAILPGTSCVAFFPEGEAPPGDEELGVCVLP